MSWFNMPWRPEDTELVAKWKKERGTFVGFVDETLADPDADAISWALGFPITKQINTPMFDVPHVKIERKRKKRIPLTDKERNIILDARGRKCEDCGKDHDLQIHHLDGNPANNALENLMVACYTCHKIRDRKIAKLVAVIAETGATISEVSEAKTTERDVRIEYLMYQLEQGTDLEVMQRTLLIESNLSLSGVNNLIKEARLRLAVKRELQQNGERLD
jgi:hypothetical protein